MLWFWFFLYLYREKAICVAIGAKIMPKKPINLAPKYIVISVAIGCIPRPAPKIFGSKKLRIRFIIAKVTKRLIAILNLLLRKRIKAQGTITIPEPTKGMASKQETIAAVPIGFLILIMKKPVQSSKKQANVK